MLVYIIGIILLIQLFNLQIIHGLEKAQLKPQEEQLQIEKEMC